MPYKYEHRTVYCWACGDGINGPASQHIWREARTYDKKPPRCPICGQRMKFRGTTAEVVVTEVSE